MSVFESYSRHLWEVLIFRFHLKKTAAEAHPILSSTYGEAALSERTCREWFQNFKNGDFDVEDRHGGGKENIFEDCELEALLAEESCQTQEELAESLRVTPQAISKRLKAMGMIQKQGNWVPYKLNPRDVERLFFACEQLLQRQNRKGFLHRIVTGDEKWIHYDNPKHDNPRSHVARAVKTYIETLKWDVLPNLPYSSNVALFDYRLLRIDGTRPGSSAFPLL